MSRKKKNGAKKPPLSALDKAIYRITIMAGIGLILLLWLLFGLWIPEKIGYLGEGAIACGDQWGILTAMPFGFCIGVTVILIASKGLDTKQPIFGNKEVKASVLRPMLTVYPLVSKEFWQKMTDKTKKNIKWWSIFFLVIFMICLTVLFLGLYPRSVLYEDGNIENYGITNQVTDMNYINTADSITLEIDAQKRNKSVRYDYYLYLTFSFNGKKDSFEIDDFKKMSDKDALLYMQSLKERFGERCELVGADLAKKLIAEKQWDAEEKEALYELFDLK
jgi:hypothetical protein